MSESLSCRIDYLSLSERSFELGGLHLNVSRNNWLLKKSCWSIRKAWQEIRFKMLILQLWIGKVNKFSYVYMHCVWVNWCSASSERLSGEGVVGWPGDMLAGRLADEEGTKLSFQSYFNNLLKGVFNEFDFCPVFVLNIFQETLVLVFQGSPAWARLVELLLDLRRFIWVCPGAGLVSSQQSACRCWYCEALVEYLWCRGWYESNGLQTNVLLMTVACCLNHWKKNGKIYMPSLPSDKNAYGLCGYQSSKFSRKIIRSLFLGYW